LYTHYSAVALIFAVQAVDLRAYMLHGHYDGRVLIGSSVLPLYEAVYKTLGSPVNDVSPLVFNDADQSLESNLASLAENIRNEGSIVQAVAPITESINELSS
jgi:phenylalanine ammonia-lyase